MLQVRMEKAYIYISTICVYTKKNELGQVSEISCQFCLIIFSTIIIFVFYLRKIFSYNRCSDPYSKIKRMKANVGVLDPEKRRITQTECVIRRNGCLNLFCEFSLSSSFLHSNNNEQNIAFLFICYGNATKFLRFLLNLPHHPQKEVECWSALLHHIKSRFH